MVRARERKGRVRARVLAVDGFAFVGSRTAELLLLRAAPASVERESNIIVIIVLPPGSSICPRPCTHGSSSFLVQRFGVRLVRCFFFVFCWRFLSFFLVFTIAAISWKIICAMLLCRCLRYWDVINILIHDDNLRPRGTIDLVR